MLSGLETLPANPATLRTNLLILDQKLLLRPLFQDVTDPLHGMLIRLFPGPLPRDCYAKVANRLGKDPHMVAYYAGQTSELSSTDLAERFED